MTTDPNWLLSTVVQSAAAFIAIVAGFIISRLLALSAEKSGLLSRIRDMELQLKLKVQNLSSLQEKLLRWNALDFLDDPKVMMKIIESEGQISLDDIMNQVTGSNLSKEGLQPYWNKTIEVTKEAFLLIREHFSEAPDKVEDLDIFFKKLNPTLSPYDMDIYYSVYGHLWYKKDKIQNPFRSVVDTFSIAALPAVTDVSSAAKIQSYAVLRRDIEMLTGDQITLQTQLDDLRFQLKHLGKPKGVALGLYLLAYFCIAGVVIPVFLLPFPAEQFTPFYKWVIFLLFLSGLLFFFIYLFWLFRQLTDTSDPDNST